MLFIRTVRKCANVLDSRKAKYSLEEFVVFCRDYINQLFALFIYSLCLGNGVMMMLKRRLLTLRRIPLKVRAILAKIIY